MQLIAQCWQANLHFLKLLINAQGWANYYCNLGFHYLLAFHCDFHEKLVAQYRQAKLKFPKLFPNVANYDKTKNLNQNLFWSV